MHTRKFEGGVFIFDGGLEGDVIIRTFDPDAEVRIKARELLNLVDEEDSRKWQD